MVRILVIRRSTEDGGKSIVHIEFTILWVLSECRPAEGGIGGEHSEQVNMLSSERIRRQILERRSKRM